MEMVVTKMFLFTLWPWAYFTNGPDAACVLSTHLNPALSWVDS